MVLGPVENIALTKMADSVFRCPIVGIESYKVLFIILRVCLKKPQILLEEGGSLRLRPITFSYLFMSSNISPRLLQFAQVN